MTTKRGPKSASGPVREAYAAAYPDVIINWASGSAVPHPLAGLSRELELDALMATLPLGAPIIDVGGNVYHHIKAGRLNVHCCAPTLSLRDAARNTIREALLIPGLANIVDLTKSAPAKNLRKTDEKISSRVPMLERALKSFTANPDHYRCRLPAELCTAQSPYLIAVHASYDITVRSMGRIMDAHGALVMTGTFIFDPSILFAPEGYIEGQACYYEIDETNDLIHFSFRDDSTLNYTHKWTEYKKYLTTHVIETPRNTYLFELQENRCGAQFFRITLANCPSVVEMTYLSHKIWSRQFEELVYVRVFDTNYTTNDANPLRELTPSVMAVDKSLYQDALSFALASKTNQLSPDGIFTYMRTRASRVIINGIEIYRKSSEFDASGLRKVADTIYCNVVLQKDSSARVVSSLNRAAWLFRMISGLHLLGLLFQFFRNCKEWLLPTNSFVDVIRRFAAQSSPYLRPEDLALLKNPVLSIAEWYQSRLKEDPDMQVLKVEWGRYNPDSDEFKKLVLAHTQRDEGISESGPSTNPRESADVSGVIPPTAGDSKPIKRSGRGHMIDIEQLLRANQGDFVGELFATSHGRSVTDADILRLELSEETLAHGTTDGTSFPGRVMDYYYYLLMDVHGICGELRSIWRAALQEDADLECSTILNANMALGKIFLWRLCAPNTYSLMKVTNTAMTPAYVFDGDRLIKTLPNSLAIGNTIKVESQSRYLISSEACLIFPQPELLKVAARFPLNYIMPDTVLVEGVPGCGKTTFTVKLANDEDLILTATRNAADNLRKRLEAAGKSKERVFTLDSYLINHTKIKAGRLLIDEGLMAHPGAIVLVSQVSGASKVVILGDSNQLNFIPRVAGYVNYYGAGTSVYRVVSMNLSYRCPADVAYAFSDLYANGFFTTSSVTDSLRSSLYTNDQMLRDLQADVYLSFTQDEKATLTKAGLKAFTINEAQGETFGHVVLVRIVRAENSIYDDKKQMLVGLTRHTNKFTYVTVNPHDPLAEFIKRISKTSNLNVCKTMKPPSTAFADADIIKAISPLSSRAQSPAFSEKTSASSKSITSEALKIRETVDTNLIEFSTTAAVMAAVGRSVRSDFSPLVNIDTGRLPTTDVLAESLTNTVPVPAVPAPDTTTKLLKPWYKRALTVSTTYLQENYYRTFGIWTLLMIVGPDSPASFLFHLVLVLCFFPGVYASGDYGVEMTPISWYGLMCKILAWLSTGVLRLSTIISRLLFSGHSGYFGGVRLVYSQLLDTYYAVLPHQRVVFVLEKLIDFYDYCVNNLKEFVEFSADAFKNLIVDPDSTFNMSHYATNLKNSAFDIPISLRDLWESISSLAVITAITIKGGVMMIIMQAMSFTEMLYSIFMNYTPNAPRNILTKLWWRLTNAYATKTLPVLHKLLVKAAKWAMRLIITNQQLIATINRFVGLFQQPEASEGLGEAFEKALRRLVRTKLNALWIIIEKWLPLPGDLTYALVGTFIVYFTFGLHPLLTFLILTYGAIRVRLFLSDYLTYTPSGFNTPRPRGSVTSTLNDPTKVSATMLNREKVTIRSESASQATVKKSLLTHVEGAENSFRNDLFLQICPNHDVSITSTHKVLPRTVSSHKERKTRVIALDAQAVNVKTSSICVIVNSLLLSATPTQTTRVNAAVTSTDNEKFSLLGIFRYNRLITALIAGLLLFLIIMLCLRHCMKRPTTNHYSDSDDDDDDDSDHPDRETTTDDSVLTMKNSFWEKKEEFTDDNSLPLASGDSIAPATVVSYIPESVQAPNSPRIFELVKLFGGLFPNTGGSAYLHERFVTMNSFALPRRPLVVNETLLDSEVALNEVFSDLYPDLPNRDNTLDEWVVENTDMELRAQDTSIETVLLNNPSVPTMKGPRYVSSLKTAQPNTRPKTSRQLLLALTKRNWDSTNLALPSNLTQDIPKVIDVFLSTFCNTDAKSLLSEFENRPVVPQDNTLIDWLSRMNDSKVKSVLSQLDYTHDVEMSRYSLMIKTEPKNKLQPNAVDEYLPLHNIVFHQAKINALFASVFRELYERFLDLINPSTHVHLRKNPSEITDHLNRYLNTDTDYHTLEIDFSKFDKSQLMFCFSLEMEIYRRLGLHPELLRLWKLGHTSTKARAFTSGVTARFFFQRKTGDVTTCFGNTLISLCAVAWALPQQLTPTAAYFVGDDSLIFVKKSTTNNITDLTREMTDDITQLFNLPAKLTVNRAPYFCSSFILKAAGGFCMVPDAFKTAEKLGKTIPFGPEQEVIFTRWISLADNNKYLRDAYVQEAMTAALNERYGENMNGGLLVQALVPLTLNYKKFFDLYSFTAD